MLFYVPPTSVTMEITLQNSTGKKITYLPSLPLKEHPRSKKWVCLHATHAIDSSGRYTNLEDAFLPLTTLFRLD